MKSSQASWAQLACKCITCGLAHACDSDLAAAFSTTKMSIEGRARCGHDWHARVSDAGLPHTRDTVLDAALFIIKMPVTNKNNLASHTTSLAGQGLQQQRCLHEAKTSLPAT